MDDSHAAGSVPDKPGSRPKLIPRMRVTLRVRRYSMKTEKAYIHWVKRYLRFHHMRHPQEMGPSEVTALLNHLASDRMVAGATQNQALAAMLFLYRHVLGLRAQDASNCERLLSVIDTRPRMAASCATTGRNGSNCVIRGKSSN